MRHSRILKPTMEATSPENERTPEGRLRSPWLDHHVSDEVRLRPLFKILRGDRTVLMGPGDVATIVGVVERGGTHLRIWPKDRPWTDMVFMPLSDADERLEPTGRNNWVDAGLKPRTIGSELNG